MKAPEDYMRRALELARTAEGRTSPNPIVGAVIVKDDRIIGEGFHRRAGGDHAEIEALDRCTESPRGATLFVTLEPCCFFGRTPPCTQAIIEAGIEEVYFAVSDPNPKVAGRSFEILRQAGIRVNRGPLEEEATFVNRAFFYFIKTGLPYVTVKIAQSLDGKTATKSGDSQWITEPASRRKGHELRDRSDAILVGSGTVRADDPKLTTRLGGSDHHPLRVVVDSRGSLDHTHQVFQPRLPSKTLLVTTPAAPSDYVDRLSHLGVATFVCPADQFGRVNLLALFEELARRDIMLLMVEGGHTLLGSLAAQGLIQEIWAFVSPQIIGGRRAPSAVGDPGFDHLADTLKLRWYQLEQCGRDILISAINQTLELQAPNFDLPPRESP